jgi:hypothetical protein
VRDASYAAASAGFRGRAAVYFHVQWEQPGHLSGKTQSNSTVALWRYNFGVVSITGHNGFGAGEPDHRPYRGRVA